jgi:hypothetical protein
VYRSFGEVEITPRNMFGRMENFMLVFFRRSLNGFYGANLGKVSGRIEGRNERLNCDFFVEYLLKSEVS